MNEILHTQKLAKKYGLKKRTPFNSRLTRLDR